ncbi:MTH1187 family thiamine-binding protein [Salipaludibacillus aurantiacus]|uniref:Uncharacterized protein, MTH1187 family n=1 Tax=Salipaludibacillus aurantiacus TaxID=1601833 RepID=A0A1H9R8F7_9BACI|nr:MTH1187 family thiamine-binding protein [Salipaludibacillus aurantiacus]SER68339.1 uncharacterized protein, MTH1187 family [Salipaludibacillus aurantiacus]
MVKGLSFQKGIIFIGRKYAACSYNDNGRERLWIKPVTPKNMLYTGKLVFLSMPLWFHLILGVLVLLITFPFIFNLFGRTPGVSLPWYVLVYFLFGTHFWFPKELRKYHGAEHKVFSYKDKVSVRHLKEIKKANITNRYCSTNVIILFLILAAALTLLFFLYGVEWGVSVERATYGALLLLPFMTYWLHRTKETIVHKWLISLSGYLQKQVTTSEPDDLHVKTAIRAYRTLALKEFPYKIRKTRRKREVKHMAIADITIMPLGSASTSVSEVVTEVHRLLKETKLPVTYELTPMSTIIEGDIKDLYELMKEIQEVPFKLGHMRVATNIRIDDRRDKPSSMKGKVEAVNKNLGE